MIETELCVSMSVPGKVEPTQRVLQIASMFGLGVDETRTITVIPETRIILKPGNLIYVTGPSGGGKSSFLRLLKESYDGCSLNFSDLKSFVDCSIIDQIGDTLENAAKFLALAGLADAFVMLRKPCELSDGQRYRASLAKLIDTAEKYPPDKMLLVLADEFGATLDRLTAQTLCRNIRRWVNNKNQNVCFVCATTHDDLLEALQPDVLVYIPLGENLEVHTRTNNQPG